MTWTAWGFDDLRVQNCEHCEIEARGKFGLRCWYCGGPMAIGELTFRNVVRTSEVR